MPLCPRYLLPLLVLVVVAPPVAYAQFDGAPDAVSFQGHLTDDLDQPINSPQDITVRLYDASIFGNEVWSETYLDVPVSDGVFNLILESSIAALALDAGLWMQVLVEGEFVGVRSQWTSSPYTLSLRNVRIEPESDEDGPNRIGGWSGNSVATAVVGATIGGGGDPQFDFPNSVIGEYGAVAGGIGNEVDRTAFIGGGNENSATGEASVVSGGSGNRSTDNLSTAAGALNSARGLLSTIPGGRLNIASGDYSMAAGYRARALHEGAFVWNDRSQTTDTQDDALGSTDPNQFLIRAEGGVGIGTNEPGSQLHVVGDDPAGAFDAQTSIRGTDESGGADKGGSLAFRGHDGNTPRVWGWARGLKRLATIGNYASYLDLATRAHGGSPVERARFSAAGHFLPGADDTYRLGTSGVRWEGLWATDGTINTSDRRLKRDLKDLDYGLSEILALRPVRYRWKKRPEDGFRLGLIAQEAAEVVPEVVDYPHEPDDHLGLRYNELLPVVVNALREMSEAERSQDQRLSVLENVLGNP